MGIECAKKCAKTSDIRVSSYDGAEGETGFNWSTISYKLYLV